MYLIDATIKILCATKIKMTVDMNFTAAEMFTDSICLG